MPAQDLHGLALSTASDKTAQSFNHTVLGYLAYRADTPLRLRELLATDPEFALTHVLRGYFSMLSFNAAAVPAAREALATARKLANGVTRRISRRWRIGRTAISRRRWRRGSRSRMSIRWMRWRSVCTTSWRSGTAGRS